MSTPSDGSGTLRSHRLQRGLSLLFFAVLIFVSILQLTYVFTRIHHAAEEATEANGAFLADSLARSIEPFCKSGIDVDYLRRMNKLLLDIMPDASTYVIDAEGRTIAAFGSAPSSNGPIDTHPIEKFLSLPRRPGTVLYGQEPSSPSGVPDAPFAASRLTVAGKPAYVYITLHDTFLLRSLRYLFDETLLSFIIGTVFLQALIVVLIAIFLYKVLTTRLRALVGVLARYTAGDHSARADISGSDELAELARTTNQMAETIEQKIAELAERDRKRRELIANVTHDLRAPASVIKGFSEILGEQADSNEDDPNRDMYTAIVHSSDSLSKLLGQLWELSKLEARDQPLVLERLPLAELIDEIAQSFHAAAEKKGVSLVVTVGDERRPVIADPALITRAIRNLIDNALTYTLTGGTVEVRTIASEGGLRVEIRDTGVGISAEDLPQIFERSFRVKKWEGQRQDSGGLGLAIVRHIVEAHGQSITVNSRENEGSTFGFELPWAA